MAGGGAHELRADKSPSRQVYVARHLDARQNRTGALPGSCTVGLPLPPHCVFRTQKGSPTMPAYRWNESGERGV